MTDKTPNKKIILISVIFTIVLSVMSSDIYLPSLPSIVQSLHATHSEVKLTITLYLLGFCLSQLMYGPLSDAFGRRRIILSGIIISIFGIVFCLLSRDIAFLIIGRFIQGCGAGAGVSLSRAVLRDTFEGRSMASAISILSNFTGLTPIIAPLFGGYLQHYIGWQANFVFLFILSIACFCFIYRFLPETIAEKNRDAISPKNLGKNYYRLATDRSFMGYCVIVSIMYGTLFLYLALSPFLFQGVMKLNPVQYGWLGTFVGIGLIGGTYINLYFMKRMKLSGVLMIGIVIAGIAGVMMLIPHLFGLLDVIVVVIPLMVLLVACKMVFVNCFTLALKDLKHMAGTAGAMYGMMQTLGSTISTTIASFIIVRSQLPIAIIFLISFVLMFAVYFHTVIRNKS